MKRLNLLALSASGLFLTSHCPAFGAGSNYMELSEARSRAMDLFRQGNYAESQRILTALCERPINNRFTEWLVPDTMATLADIQIRQGRPDKARRILLRAIDLIAARHGKDAGKLSIYYLKLSTLNDNNSSSKVKAIQEAVRILSSCISKESQVILHPVQDLANAFKPDSPEGLEYRKIVYRIRRSKQGFYGNSNTPPVCIGYVEALLRHKMYQDAKEPLEDAIKASQMRSGLYSCDMVLSLGTKGIWLNKQGKRAEADKTFARVFELCRGTAPAGGMQLGHAERLADLLYDFKLDKEEQIMLPLLATLSERMEGQDPAFVFVICARAGRKAALRGAIAPARRLFKESEAAGIQTGGKEMLAFYLQNADALISAGYKKDALEHLAKAELEIKLLPAADKQAMSKELSKLRSKLN